MQLLTTPHWCYRSAKCWYEYGRHDAIDAADNDDESVNGYGNRSRNGNGHGHGFCNGTWCDGYIWWRWRRDGFYDESLQYGNATSSAVENVSGIPSRFQSHYAW